MSENKDNKTENYMFSENLNTFAKGENMNRDYLKLLYGEDMDFLNKDVRLTRSQYLSAYSNIENSFEDEAKNNRKNMLIPSIIFAVLLGIYLILRLIVLKDLSSLLTVIPESSYNAVLVTTGIFTTFARVSLICALVEIIFFISGFVKRKKQIKRRKEESLERLENHKKECMMFGTYDAGR